VYKSDIIIFKFSNVVLVILDKLLKVNVTSLKTE